MRGEAAVAIVSDNSWRAEFLAGLLKRVVDVAFRNDGVPPPHSQLRDADFVLWEQGVENPDAATREHRGLFVFDYTAEGSRERIQAFSTKLGIENPKGLLLLPRTSDSDMGCLPLPPPKPLGRFRIGKPTELEDRKQKYLFLCSPTALRLPEDRAAHDCDLPYCKWHKRERRFIYNQRLEWAERLFEADMLDEGNGLVEANRPDLKQEKVASAYGFDIDVFVDRTARRDFHRRMLDARVVLSPAGHSRWAYRHVESMYNRALTVSTDLSDHRSLPSLPEEALIRIPDGAFDPVFVRHLAEHAPDYQHVADLGFEFARSTYSRVSALAPFRERQSYRRDAASSIVIEFLDQLQSLMSGGRTERNSHSSR